MVPTWPNVPQAFILVIENARFLANYNEAKTMHFPMRLSKHMENARGTIGHVVHSNLDSIPKYF